MCPGALYGSPIVADVEVYREARQHSRDDVCVSNRKMSAFRPTVPGADNHSRGKIENGGDRPRRRGTIEPASRDRDALENISPLPSIRSVGTPRPDRTRTSREKSASDGFHDISWEPGSGIDRRASDSTGFLILLGVTR